MNANILASPGSHGGGAYVLATTPSAITTNPLPSQRGPSPFALINQMQDWERDSADGRMAEVTLSQWADYQSRFVPIENQLMNMTTYNNPELAGQEIGRAQADTGNAYDNIAGSSAVQLGRYGMSRTSDQQASNNRLTSLGRSGAVVDAANNIRLKLIERNQTAAAGSAPPQIT